MTGDWLIGYGKESAGPDFGNLAGISHSGVMLDSPVYSKDTQFWELLALRAKDGAEVRLVPLFDALTLQAARLELPVTFGGLKSISWALICQLFALYQEELPTAKRTVYLRMIAGYKRGFQPSRFAPVAIRRIVANISYPSSPGRTVRESIADTFLANGLSVTDQYDDTSLDEVILSRSFADPTMMKLCDRVVTPPAGVWDQAVVAYGQQRPGFLRRFSSDIHHWIFDR